MTGWSRRGVLGGVAAIVPAGRARAGLRLHGDDFRHGLAQWSIEAEQPAAVHADGGVLDIRAPAGATIWFRPVLEAPVRIAYDAMVVVAGGPTDRLSDLNCFWMAHDPAAPEDDALAHPRSGRFGDYDTLRTYYVGVGGNHNTTTRFRRYVGRAGERPLLPADDRADGVDLLVANRWQRIELTAAGGTVTFARDGRTLFRFDDAAPYTRGRFALRTTASHLRIRDFGVDRTEVVR